MCEAATLEAPPPAERRVPSPPLQAAPLAVDDPCFHPGYQAAKNYSALYDSPCVSARRPGNAPVNFTHRGAGNFSRCQKILSSIFNFSSCTSSRCSFNGVFQPPLQGTFGVRSQHLTPQTMLLTQADPPP